MDKICGKPAANLVPRLQLYFACQLLKGHDGECTPGGECVKHGKYIGKPNVPPQCPFWPDCINVSQ